MDDQIDINGEDRIPYESWNDLDFSTITMGMNWLPIFKDDLYLGMQAMNVGIVDSVITEYEYALLREWFEIERTPMESDMAVSAMSQMWIYGLYEVLRMWRDRRYQFRKLYENSGIDLKLSAMADDDPMNMTLEVRKTQLRHFKEDTTYRAKIDHAWAELEPVYRMIELFRMNLAKHCAPGKDGVTPRAPGYGRINHWCGAMNYELVEKDGYYTTMNRRDIADALRGCVMKLKNG